MLVYETWQTSHTKWKFQVNFSLKYINNGAERFTFLSFNYPDNCFNSPVFPLETCALHWLDFPSFSFLFEKNCIHQFWTSFVAILLVRWGDSCLLISLETGEHIFLGLTLLHRCKFCFEIWLATYMIATYSMCMLDKHRLIFLKWFSGTFYSLLLQDQ